MVNQPRLYLGHGMLADRALVEELLGRPLKPMIEFETTIYGFRLKVLRREELPKKVQDATDEGFRIYGLVEDRQRRFGVKVLPLELSEQEAIAVSALNFGNDLYESRETFVFVGAAANVDVLRDQTAGTFVESGLDYPPFLNGREASMANARALHNRFIRPSQEGNQSSGTENRF